MQFDLKSLPEHRVGFWLPKDRRLITEWVNKLMVKARKKNIRNIDPLLQAFQKVVASDVYLNALSVSMFNEVPNVPPYNKDPNGQPEVKSFNDMLLAIDTIMTTAPPWSDAADRSGLIGFPINAVLDWPMATASGFAFFLEPKVNDCLRLVLTKWCKYLQDIHQDSNLVLYPPNGWLGIDGLKALTSKGDQNGLSPADKYTFTQLYVCPNPDDPNTLGFESWDAFFIREFQDNVRPLDPTADIVHLANLLRFNTRLAMSSSQITSWARIRPIRSKTCLIVTPSLSSSLVVRYTKPSSQLSATTDGFALSMVSSSKSLMCRERTTRRICIKASLAGNPTRPLRTTRSLT